MTKTLFLVRHGKAEGQEPGAPLIAEGIEQASKIADILERLQIHKIISSPFTRAVQSIEPLASRLRLAIALDLRLIEASLSTVNYPDWLDRLRATFDDFELAFEGGESSRVASERGIAAVNDALHSGFSNVVIVTHGRLLTLILRHFDSQYGFDNWKNLTTPDIFQLTVVGPNTTIERLWKSDP
jgi:2,3-bisphosphoglycerate-dependent phosphoglycerate mutase